jgi:alkanesulfonate monooxygenase SsuD/methylene tetrahydromethanopterin reductase-like flavin-dependent oxidoreductase (luciferase family)
MRARLRAYARQLYQKRRTGRSGLRYDCGVAPSTDGRGRIEIDRNGAPWPAAATPNLDARQLSFGLFITAIHQPQDDMRARVAEHRAQVELARDGGFQSIVLGQHLLAAPTQMLAPIPTLASLCDISGDMRLVLGVLLLPLLDPIQVAEDIATLDVLSGGRVVIGAGLGFRSDEALALGIARDSLVARFDECLAVIRSAWTAESRWSFSGRHRTYSDAPAGLRPHQQPLPPLWIGGEASNAVRRAASYGVPWYVNPRAPAALISSQLGVYDDELRRGGLERPRTMPIRREIVVRKTHRQAIEVAGRYLAGMDSLYANWRSGAGGLRPNAASQLVGTPGQVLEALDEYRSLGFNHVVLRAQWPGMPQSEVLETIRLVAEDIVPHLERDRGKSSTHTVL